MREESENSGQWAVGSGQWAVGSMEKDGAELLGMVELFLGCEIIAVGIATFVTVLLFVISGQN